MLNLSEGRRLQFGLDIDDTLGEFMRTFLKYYRKEHGQSVAYRDCWTYHIGNALGLEDETAMNILNSFSTSFLDNLPAIRGAKKAVKYLSGIADLHVITARDDAYSESTKRWLNDRFGVNFSTVNFCYNRWSGTPGLKKHEVAREIGLDYMVEDHHDYAREISQTGTHVFLLRRPWNQHFEVNGNTNVTLCRGWDDIIQNIKKKHDPTEI